MSTELKNTIQELGETVHDFKNSVDERLKLVEKNQSTGDVDAKLEKMNDRLDVLDDVKTQIEDLETKAGRFGKGAKSAVVDEHKQAFEDFIVKGIEDGLDDLQVKAVNIATDSEGGYAVPETLDREIERFENEEVVMRRECRVIPVSNENYRKLVSKGGVASGWVGEEESRPETSSPSLVQIVPTFGEIYANPHATQKALDDLENVESWLAEEVAQEFVEQEDAAFLTGNGAKKPLGLLANTMTTEDDDVRAVGTIQHMLSGSDAALGADTAQSIDNLIDLSTLLKTRYLNGAKWMLGRDALRLVRKLKDADGNLIWQQSLQAGQPSMLLENPLVRNDAMPGVAAESNSIMFGNYRRAYTILDVRGTRILRDPYTKKPFVGFYTTKRVGGMLVNSEAVKVLRLGDGT